MQWTIRTKAGYKRIAVMVSGIILLGLGICLFKLSMLGNDPSSAMMMAIGSRIHVNFAKALLAANCLWFLAEWVWGRCYLGLGTFVNWFGVGTISMAFTELFTHILPEPESFPQKLAVMVIGMLVLSLAASLYQTADLGIAPYDSLALMLQDRLPLPYFWCRMATDTLCVIICLLFGGLAGIGTLVCALGLGPFIQFFNHFISEKLVAD